MADIILLIEKEFGVERLNKEFSLANHLTKSYTMPAASGRMILMGWLIITVHFLESMTR